jgi:tetratricopeptide (TPR) repeat protein
MDKLKIEEVDKNEFMFVWPRSADKASDLFFEALDYADEGDLSKARQLLRKAIEIFPEHIDTIAHLGMMSSNNRESIKLSEKAFQIGWELISGKLDDKSKIEWGWTENRPFLRACHTKGLNLLKENRVDEAIKLLNQMIKWNPNDNQGVRDLLADIYTIHKMSEEMIDLSKKYPDSYDPSINFGLALAFFRKSNRKEADKALKQAIRNFPICGKILLEDKPKKPKSEMPGYITMGGEDQAYEFWEGQREAWKEKELQEWVKEAFKAI